MAQNSSIVVFNQLIKMKDSVQHASDQLSKISALLQKIARPAQFSDFNSTTARKIQSSPRDESRGKSWCHTPSFIIFSYALLQEFK